MNLEDIDEQSREEKILILREKHAQIPIILNETGIDCWMIFVRETSLTPDSIMELVVGNDVVLPSAFIFGFQEDKFVKTALIGNFDADSERNKNIWDEVIAYEKSFQSQLQKILENYNPKLIGLNFSKGDPSADGLTHGLFLYLEDLLPSFKEKFVSAESIINRLRSYKTPTEIINIRKAGEITELFNRKITNTIKPGMNALKIQHQVWQWVESYNLDWAWQKNNNPAIDAGPEKRFGHIEPLAENTLKQGHTLHNDFGVKYHGYCSDLQRMWFFGTKDEVPDELRHAIDTIVTAIQKAAAAIRPGVPGYKIDQIARDYIQKRGYQEYLHALGHQVGRNAHDGGVLLGPLWERYGDKPKGLLQKNQVFTLEPSLHTTHFGDVSLEEMILVTDTGCEFIIPPVSDFIYILPKE